MSRQVFVNAEDGSIPLTILVAIIMGGLIVSLFAIVQSGANSSSRDRDFAQAIHVADAGVQEAYVTLRDSFANSEIPCTRVGNTMEAGICSGELGNGGVFEWEYERRPGGGWNVLSLGAYQDSIRAVEATITQQSVFDLAITTRTKFRWDGGGNTVIDPQIFVGTFGDAELPTSAAANQAIAGVVPFGNGPHNISPPEKIVESSQEPPDLDRDIAAENCSERIANDTLDEALTGNGGTLERGRDYCVPYVSVRGTWTLEGENPEESVSINVLGLPPGNNNPVFELRTNTSFNDGGQAEDLNIFVAQGAGKVNITTNTSSAMTVYAPWSLCEFNGVPTFWGALTCDVVHLRGNFYYQEDTDSTSAGDASITNWLERPPPRRELTIN